SVFGLADFSQQPAEMSLTLSYFSILNYIQKGNLPASAGSRSVLRLALQQKIGLRRAGRSLNIARCL
ncbi:MAG: hypothetical protein ACI9ND_002754, partial [Yoonia sp.]